MAGFEMLSRVLKDSRYICFPDLNSGASRNIPALDIAKMLEALALYLI